MFGGHAAVDVAKAHIEAFWADGAIALRGVVDAGWRRVLAGAIEADIADPGPFFHGYEPENGRGRFHGNLRTWEWHEGFRRFCFESPLPGIAQRLLRSRKINLFYDQLFVKEPDTANRTRWHNDQPYWPIDGRQVLSFWVALDPTDRESGALEFVRGSHLWGRFFQPEAFGRSAVASYERNPGYQRIPDIDADRGAYDIISFDLEPGDVYAFHALTVHGAGGNLSAGKRRRGYAVRYTGDDIVYSSQPASNKGLRNPLLKDGGALDSEQYPLVRADLRKTAGIAS